MKNETHSTLPGNIMKTRMVGVLAVMAMNCCLVCVGCKKAKPTAKQHLAAIRMLFDWLVIGQVIPTSPAHAVRARKPKKKAKID